MHVERIGKQLADWRVRTLFRQRALLAKEKVTVEPTAAGERVRNLKAHLVRFGGEAG